MKVLVVMTAAGGDFLMATPALRALKLSGKATAVHLLAGRSLQELVRDNPHLDRIHYVGRRWTRPGKFPGKTAGLVETARRLRREKFDLGINCNRDGRLSVILFLAGCKKRIGFARGRGSIWLTDALRSDGVKHLVFRYCDLLKGQGIFCLDFKLEFPGAETDLAAASEKYLRPHDLKEYVVLAPGGGLEADGEKDNRSWPEGHFAALAGLLVRAGQRVMLLGGAGDAGAAAAIKAAHPAVADLTGRATLAEMAALMKMSRLAVCNDSGLMHLAAAAGARVISIFGPTPPCERKPLNEGSTAVWKGEDMDCSPCCHDGIFPRCDHVSCLKKITPQEIFNLISSEVKSDQ